MDLSGPLPDYLEHLLKDCTLEERAFLIKSWHEAPPLAEWQIQSLARLQAAVVPPHEGRTDVPEL